MLLECLDAAWWVFAELGEHGAWEKYTTWEDGTRIPMIIRDPGAKPGRTAALFESVRQPGAISSTACLPVCLRA